MPALEPYLIEPIFEQFKALLPEHETDQPACEGREEAPKGDCDEGQGVQALEYPA